MSEQDLENHAIEESDKSDTTSDRDGLLTEIAVPGVENSSFIYEAEGACAESVGQTASEGSTASEVASVEPERCETDERTAIDAVMDAPLRDEVSMEEAACEVGETEEVPTEELDEVPIEVFDELADAVAPQKADDLPKEVSIEKDILQPDALPAVTKVGGLVLRPIHLIISAVALVILMTGCVFLGIWLNQNVFNDPEIDSGIWDYNDRFEDVINPNPETIVAPGYTELTLKAGTRDVQMILHNPEGNPCYFRFILELGESREELYRSGLIPPGKAISEITLSRPLQTGTYVLYIRVETLSLENKTPMNGIDNKTTLTVIP